MLEDRTLRGQDTRVGYRSQPHLLLKTLPALAGPGSTPGVARAAVPGGSPPGALGWWCPGRAVHRHPSHMCCFYLHLSPPRPRPSVAAAGVPSPGQAPPSTPLSLSWPWGLAFTWATSSSGDWAAAAPQSPAAPLRVSHPTRGLLGI